MKVCIFSDLHIHPWQEFATVDERGVNTRLLDTINALSQVKKISEREKCGVVLFSGDLFHVPKIDTLTLDLAARAISQFEIPLVMIPGNHDEASKYAEFHSLRIFNKMKPWIKVLDGRDGSKTKIDNTKIGGIPFVGSNDALLAEYKRLKGCDIVMMHTGFAGATAGFEYIADQKDYIQTPSLKMEKRGIRWIIAGHFHDPQASLPGKDGEMEPFKKHGIKKLPEGTVLIPGAPLHHTFGDAKSKRGCWILDTEKEEAEFISLKLPKFKVFRVLVWNNIEEAKADVEGNYVRFTGPKEVCKKAEEILREAGTKGYRLQVETKLSRAKGTQTGFEMKRGEAIANYIKANKNRPASRKRLTEVGFDILKKGEALL